MIATFQETWSGTKLFRIPGRYIRLLETVNPVNVKLGLGGQGHDFWDAVQAGAWMRLPAGAPNFDFISITTQSSETVKFVVADGEAGYDRLFTAFAQATALSIIAGNVTVGVTEVAVVGAATRSKIVFTADPANGGTIALGPVGVTMANGAILLGPGDTWVEDLAAAAAWRAIATSAAQVLRVLTAA